MRRPEHAEIAHVTRRTFLGRIARAGVLAMLCLARASTGVDLPVQAQQRIEAALPARAPVQVSKPRRLLIFDLNVGYGGHGSVRFANLALSRMGKKTGAFDTVLSRDPDVFRPERLKQFDAVFLNNTVGNLFTHDV